MLRLGPRAMAGLTHFEGVRLRAYLCPAKKWTIGYGNTFYEDGSPVRQGDVITLERAIELKKNIVEKEFAEPVRRAIGNAPTTPAQFGAMVLLAYNIGVGAFLRSQVLAQHLRGNYKEAAKAFMNWVRVGPNVSKGLVRRRTAERLLYEGRIEEYDKIIGFKG